MVEAIVALVIAFIGMSLSVPVCTVIAAVVGDLISGEADGGLIASILGFVIGGALSIVCLIFVIINVIRIFQLAFGVPVTV